MRFGPQKALGVILGYDNSRTKINEYIIKKIINLPRFPHFHQFSTHNPLTLEKVSFPDGTDLSNHKCLWKKLPHRDPLPFTQLNTNHKKVIVKTTYTLSTDISSLEILSHLRCWREDMSASSSNSLSVGQIS